MSIPLLCIALLAFLGIGLGFAVSSIRGKTGVVHGSSTDPEDILYKTMRAHGNTVEYVSILALLIYILGQVQQPAWVIWFMVLVTVSRYSFAAGMIFPKSLDKRNPMRLLGAMGTYIFGIGLCIAVLLQALNA